MNQSITAAIIFNGISERVLSSERDPFRIVYDIPDWFKKANEMLSFPEEHPDPDAFVMETPESMESYRIEVMNYTSRRDEWNTKQALILLRKWIIWLSKFCDENYVMQPDLEMLRFSEID
jgi:hypothetical protein